MWDNFARALDAARGHLWRAATEMSAGQVGLRAAGASLVGDGAPLLGEALLTLADRLGDLEQGCVALIDLAEQVAIGRPASFSLEAVRERLALSDDADGEVEL